jgi:glycolate oxidase iron-sulfur subunit
LQHHDISQKTLKQADQCVMCGLCLPHCATYLERRNENESPRGRISLIQGYLRGQLAASDSLQQHLEQCLLCRSCEAMCPSNVSFGDIMEQARLQLWNDRTPAGIPPQLQQLSAGMGNIQSRLLRLYQRSGLQWLLRNSGLGRLLFGETVFLLPPLPPQNKLAHYYPAFTTARGKVALFTGCISQTVERHFQADSITLLRAAGYDVHIPPAQACCGAMHYHSGDARQSQQLIQRNQQTFSAENYDHVVFLASGCGLFLQEHLVVNGIRIMDIYSFLAQHGEQLTFASLESRVSIHIPCSLRQIPQAAQSMIKLLEKIPGLKPEIMPQNNICCGGAGSALLQQPQLARGLRARKASIMANQKSEYVLTANTGCYIQLGRALREHKIHSRVCYPVKLLAQQLQYNN